MSDENGRQKLDSLSATLNSLVRKGLSVSETAEQRAALAAIAADFNDIATPAAEKLLPALSQVTDYSARWVLAKMLRDIALKDEDKAGEIANALYNDFAKTGDADTRRMASGLLSSIATTHEGQAVRIASHLSMMLEGENDVSAKIAEKNALMGLAMKYEMTAPLAVTSIAVAAGKEPSPGFRIQLLGDLRDIGKKYASQAQAVIKQLSKAGVAEKDGLAAQHCAENITQIVQAYPHVTPQGLEALGLGFSAASENISISGYSRAFGLVGRRHPAAALSAMSNLLDNNLSKAHRHALYLSIGEISQMGGVPSIASVSVFAAALAKETDVANRRVLVNGLVIAAANGNDEGEKVKDVLKLQLSSEKDSDTVKFIERSLKTLGDVRTPVPNVLSFRPVTP